MCVDFGVVRVRIPSDCQLRRSRIPAGMRVDRQGVTKLLKDEPGEWPRQQDRLASCRSPATLGKALRDPERQGHGRPKRQHGCA
jgi:hypothetical protein